MFGNHLGLSGLIPPMITPLTDQGDIDLKGLEQLIEHMIMGGVSGLFVLGTSGEGPWLTPVQGQYVLEQTLRLTRQRVPILAACLESGTRRTVDAIHRAEAAGADAIVVATPYYFEADTVAQFHHVKTAAAATSLPVMLYNIPSTTYNPMTVETVCRLLDIENVIGIKDSSGDWQLFKELLSLRALKPGFTVLQGTETRAAEAILAGADGLVAGLGNLAPQLFVHLIDAARIGDKETAYNLQEQISDLWKLHTHGYWLVCLKYAASTLGFGSGRMYDANGALSEVGKTEIHQLVHKYCRPITTGTVKEVVNNRTNDI